MKCKLPFILFVFSFFYAQAQVINIPDANFKSVLVNTNCATFDEFGQDVGDVDTNDDGEIQMSEVEAVLKLNVSNSNIASLVGINSFINLEELRCNSNQLTALDVSSLNQMVIFECFNNQITFLDVSNFVNQSYINCNNNLISDLIVGESNNIVWLQCRDNQLTTLELNGSSNLEVLLCSNNQLNTLFIKNGSDETAFGLFNGNPEDSFNFSNNDNLQYICADGSEIAIVQNLIDTYGYDCEINSLCSFDPEDEFYAVEGTITYDFDSNGCDLNDALASNFKFDITNGVANGVIISNSTGNYSIPLQSGSFTITPDVGNSQYFSVSPTSIDVDFPFEESPFLQNFCLTPNGINNDLDIYLIPLSSAIPGFESSYKIVYRNIGNTLLSGNVEFDYSFDSDYMQYVSSLPLELSNMNNILSWDFTDLVPFEAREIIVIFNLNTPTDSNFPLNSGFELNFATTVYPLLDDETPNNNDVGFKQLVVNSFDPNDIRCLEGETILPERVGEYVHYMIRFENLGTANATNIAVNNTIDITKFDINTLVPIDGSHDYYTRINSGNDVEFIFENINLPFDDANNDGYLVYKIRTLNNLVLGDEFSNQAEIYFDFNAPIITNLYTTEVAEDDLSVSDTSLTKIKVYPNPVSDSLTIEGDMVIDSAAIYDINGREMLNTIFEENLYQLDLSILKTGIYFLKLESNSKIETLKIIKK